MSVELQSKDLDWQKLPEDTGVQEHRWTREEYYRAYEAGVFDPEARLELIQGVIYRMSPQKGPHFTAITRGRRILAQVFAEGYEVRTQGPVRLPNESEPEPDILVAVGSLEDYAQEHPSVQETVLLIEVSDSTLRFDLGRKAVMYAEAGVADFWILSLNERCLYVHREPAVLPERPFAGYRSIVRYEENEVVLPLAMPEASITVSDLLPPPVHE